MYSTPLAEALAALPAVSAAERETWLTDSALSELKQAFLRVPDPRGQRGRRYSLVFLLTCFVAALLCRCDSTVAVEQWCQEHQALLRAIFGPQRSVTPSSSLYRRLLPRLSAEHLEWALAGWVHATRAPDDQEPLALDGKVLRGARPPDNHGPSRTMPMITAPAAELAAEPAAELAAEPTAETVPPPEPEDEATAAAPHLLAFYTAQTQEVVLQVRVAAKTNEIPVAQALLPLLLTHSGAGRIVTADALHTQVALVRAVRAQGGHVVLTVKGNQPSLQADLAVLFADPLTPLQEAHTCDYQRGRREVRHLDVTTDLTAFLATESPWPDIAQVGRLTRTTSSQGRTTTTTVYLITTLPPTLATPQRLLRLIRHHWHIENGLHYIRDVVFGEDRSRLRTGHAPQVVAALRNLALTLLRRTGMTSITAARRTLSYHPEHALALLGLHPPI